MTSENKSEPNEQRLAALIREMDVDAPAPDNAALAGNIDARQEPHQGGLARPVRSDDADVRTFGKHERHIPENVMTPEACRIIFAGVDKFDHRSSSRKRLA